MFQQPHALWGLLALAIPILVHLFNLRPPRLVLFSQLAFVRAVNVVVVRRLKLKRYLLLALRLLAILAAVLAFAGPSCSPRPNGQAGPTQVVLVLDNSLSMTLPGRQGPALEAAKQAARGWVKAAGSGTSFQVVGLGSSAQANGFFAPADALEQIDAVRPEARGKSLATLVAQVPRLFEGQASANRQVVVFSDFQPATVLADSLRQRPDSSVAHWLVPLGSASGSGVYLGAPTLTAPALDAGQPVEVALTVVAPGETPADNLPLQLYLNGQVVASQRVSVPAGGETRVTLSYRPSQAGWQAGWVELQGAGARFDSRRYLAFEVPARAKLLLVAAQPGQPYLPALLQTLERRFETTPVAATRLPTLSLNDYQVIVLSGVPRLGSGLVQRLADWVIAGGGLVVFPGDGFLPDEYNPLYARLGVGVWQPRQTLDPWVPVVAPDLEHPLFEGVFGLPQSRAVFDDPTVGQLQPLRPATGRVQATVLRLESGEAVLHEARVGRGVVYSFGVAPELGWTDLPIKSSFAPVVYRTLLLASGKRDPILAYDLEGERPVELTTARPDLVRLVAPDGTELIPDQVAQPTGVALRLARTPVAPGTYRAFQADSLLAALAFNPSARESDPRVANADALTDWLEAQGASASFEVVAGTPDQVALSASTASAPAGAWRVWVLVVLLCLVGEVLVVRLLN